MDLDPATLRRNLAEGQVRLELPAGRVRLDPGASCLVVRRRPRGSEPDWLDALVAERPSYVLSDCQDGTLGELTVTVVATLADRAGPVLVVEAWTGDAPAVEPAPHAPPSTVAALVEALPMPPDAEPPVREAPCPPAMAPLLTAEDCRRVGAVPVGLRVPRDLPEDGQRRLAEGLDRALHDFTEVQTHLRRDQFAEIPPGALDDVTISIDRCLDAVARDVDFLMNVTPVDADRAWDEFEANGYRRPPSFHYRPLAEDPDLLLRRLYDAPLEEVEEPTISALLRAARHEVARRTRMLRDRDTDRFLPGSLQVYGGVDDDLLDTARHVLERLPPERRRRSGPTVGAKAFADAATEEFRHYDATTAGDDGLVSVRDDVLGVLVREGRLLVGRRVRIPVERVEALLQHEVGTHVVTYLNGADQPLHLLRGGLVRYEETQEGLGVFAEHLAGGLDGARLALLAGRVVAVRAVVDGAEFPDTFAMLTGTYGFSPRAAFGIATRVHRSGGLTKDAIYLRGLEQVLGFVGSGGDLNALLAGKLSIDHLDTLERLRDRGILPMPRHRPRWLESGVANGRLDSARRGTTIADIVEEAAA